MLHVVQAAEYFDQLKQSETGWHLCISALATQPYSAYVPYIWCYTMRSVFISSVVMYRVSYYNVELWLCICWHLLGKVVTEAWVMSVRVCVCVRCSWMHHLCSLHMVIIADIAFLLSIWVDSASNGALHGNAVTTQHAWLQADDVTGHVAVSCMQCGSECYMIHCYVSREA